MVATAASHAAADWQAGGVPICNAPYNQEYPAIAPDGQGGVFVVWNDQRDSAATRWDIYAQRLDADGVALWGKDGVLVCALPGNQADARVAPDGMGGVLIAWDDHRSGWYYNIYAQRLDPQGIPLWTPNGVCLRPTTNDQYLSPNYWHRAVASDGHGGAIVAWLERVTGFDTDVYAQRVDSAGTPRWTSVGVPVVVAYSFQFYPTLVSDQQGGAIIAWEDSRTYPTAHIYAQRLDSGGVAQWADNGILVCDPGGNHDGLAIAANGPGEATMAWVDQGSPDDRIFAQRVGPSGVLQWQPGGVLVCGSPGQKLAVWASDDTAGGTILAWTDSRTNPTCPGGCDFDLYAQRLNATGTPMWLADGSSVCAVPGDLSVTALASDGNDGTYLVWLDDRGPPEEFGDLYAQHLSASGAALWTANGVRLAIPQQQWWVSAVADGAGGAWFAWGDGRNGYFDGVRHTNMDIYAGHLAPAGAVTVPTTPSPRPYLLPPRPNPTRNLTAIELFLPKPGPLVVEVFDLTGHRIRALASSRAHPAGSRVFIWDGMDEHSRPVKAGVYLVRVEFAGTSLSRKIALLR